MNRWRWILRFCIITTKGRMEKNNCSSEQETQDAIRSKDKRANREYAEERITRITRETSNRQKRFNYRRMARIKGKKQET